jgi:energy-converting hydrogenase Eha subunit G
LHDQVQVGFLLVFLIAQLAELSLIKEMSTSLRMKNSDHANLIIHQDLIMDVVKLTDRIMVVDVGIDKTLVVVKI